MFFQWTVFNLPFICFFFFSRTIWFGWCFFWLFFLSFWTFNHFWIENSLFFLLLFFSLSLKYWNTIFSVGFSISHFIKNYTNEKFVVTSEKCFQKNTYTSVRQYKKCLFSTLSFASRKNNLFFFFSSFNVFLSLIKKKIFCFIYFKHFTELNRFNVLQIYKFEYRWKIKENDIIFFNFF